MVGGYSAGVCVRGPHNLGYDKFYRRNCEYNKRVCKFIWKDQGLEHRYVEITGAFSIYYYNFLSSILCYMCLYFLCFLK